jgi:hypothetical protein
MRTTRDRRTGELVVAAILLLASGCLFKKKPNPEPAPAAAPAPSQPAPAPAPAAPADFMDPVEQEGRLYYDDAAVFTDSLRVIVRDQQSLETLWNRASSGQASAPELPVVDWERYMVVLVAGGGMHPGDQIRVDSVGTRDSRATSVIVVRTTVQCNPFPATSYPFEIVRVRRSEEPVVFLERRVPAEDCEK